MKNQIQISGRPLISDDIILTNDEYQMIPNVHEGYYYDIDNNCKLWGYHNLWIYNKYHHKELDNLQETETEIIDDDMTNEMMYGSVIQHPIELPSFNSTVINHNILYNYIKFTVGDNGQIPDEMLECTKENILQQVSQSMLAQSNQTQQEVLFKINKDVDAAGLDVIDTPIEQPNRFINNIPEHDYDWFELVNKNRDYIKYDLFIPIFQKRELVSDLGIEILQLSDEVYIKKIINRGFFIFNINDDSPLKDSDMQFGDIIIKVNTITPFLMRSYTSLEHLPEYWSGFNIDSPFNSESYNEWLTIRNHFAFQTINDFKNMIRRCTDRNILLVTYLRPSDLDGDDGKLELHTVQIKPHMKTKKVEKFSNPRVMKPNVFEIHN